MKKHVLLAAGLAVLSTNAFATKARMEALGQNTNRGSLYIQDNRNIFRNAAHVNTLKNYVVTEWGTGDYSTLDSATAPKAEGGYFKEAGSFAWGLYFGSDINTLTAQRNGAAYGFPTATGGTSAVAISEAGFIDPGNKLDAFFGGDAGAVEWGFRLGYASDKEDNNGVTFKRTASLWQTGLGVVFGDLQGYANLDLSNEAKGGDNASDKWEGDLGLNLGVNYTFMGYTAWLEYNKQGSEYTNNAATFNPEWEQTTWQLGVGRTHEINSGARLYTDAKITMTKEEAKTTATSTSKYSSTFLPITFGFEVDATSWLTLRGNLVGHLVGNNKYEVTGATTVKAVTDVGSSVAAGATLNFGKLKVDGTIGTTTTSAARDLGTQEGVLALDNLMSRVSVHYWF